MKNTFLILILILVPISIFAQWGNGSNMNNGRSNKDRCCDNGIVLIDSNSNSGILDDKTVWYQPGETTSDKHAKTTNPISKIKKSNSEIQAKLFSSNGKFIKSINIRIIDGKTQLPKIKLNNGSYYIELSHESKIYRTGISIENEKKTKSAKSRVVKRTGGK